MEQPSTSGARSEQFLRNIFLLKNGDFEVINGQIHMPTKSEIATIRARTDQYKRNVEFNARMSSDVVKKKLEETFPYLKDKGFFCAAKRNVDSDAARFDFDGSPHRWNGTTIKKKIQGNSALYILENDQMDTSSGISASDSESSQGCNQPVQMLSLLVYVAAEIGAQQFLEILFTSSAGRVVFNSYKENLTLPEVIARDHGKEETANYLEDVTKRFSDETTTDKECSQTIYWWELVKAAEAAEKQLDLTSEKEDDIPKETGYLGDIDTSSSESSEAQSSDSDDDISRTSRKETRTKKEECKQPVWQHKDHAIEANMASLTQSPILFLKTYFKTKTLKWKENGLHLIQVSRVHDAYNVREVKDLQGSGINILLGLGSEPVPHHLITAYERLGYVLALSTERNAYYKMHIDTVEDHYSLEHLSITVGNLADHKASRLDFLQQLCSRLNNGEFTATANREDLNVRRKSAECLMEHCQSIAHDFWVLTYKFRPRRKILFVYAADSKDVFPFASCFNDRQYELSWECQQWERCKYNVFKVQEICKLPESKSGKKGEIWLQGDLHRRDSNRDSEDSIAGNYQGRKEILPQFESKSSKNGEIWQQGDLYRKDRNRDGEDTIAGNYRGRKETLHQFESNSGKKGEIWQQGDQHRKDRHRDTGNSIADNYLDRRKTLHQLESKSGKKGEIWLQGVLRRRGSNRNSEDLFAGIVLSWVLFIGAGFGYMMGWFPNLMDITGVKAIMILTIILLALNLLAIILLAIILLEIIKLLYRRWNNKMERTTEDFESKSKSGKKGEIWQQGDLHRKDPNRDTGNPVASNYLDRKKSSTNLSLRAAKKVKFGCKEICIAEIATETVKI